MSDDDARRSPARGAWCSISSLIASGPITCFKVPISSRSEALCPLPMLITSPGAFSLCVERIIAATTSLTWTKSRVCCPSPKTMGRVPASSRVVKRGMAAA